ncbi:hypothetical protein AU255_00560 [Methyloprofundus sedimenti]|uniref:DUF5666 domain-containing protein n=1 Tax=Methyloprofundus sedimenti TaxID=1420851 RepID=A0A1V8M4E8_9GAMM|nr:hypothetical protein [Methyloprofundus sedimenti]OQK16435.1 hypothetical protein AU255_00560 [Methyloprofundus sedimenti]
MLKKIHIGVLIATIFMPVYQAFAVEEPAAIEGAAINGTAVSIATVVNIDKENRMVTLKDENGQEQAFIVGPEVRNFDQLKRGDQVITQYFEGFAIALAPKDGGLKERMDSVDLQRAKLGEKPGFRITHTIAAVGTVSAVDEKKRLVTIKGEEKTVELNVSEYVDLSEVKVGDEVEAVYVQSYAVSVLPAPKVSGTVDISSTAIALGFGVEWGKGTMTMHNGSIYTFDIEGFSVLDLGIASVNATGNIYNMVEAKDLEGVFVAAEAGAVLGNTENSGISALVMRNDKGVILKLTAKEKGIRLTIATDGLKIKNIMPQ